jgi:hypothetical protein
VQQQQQQQQQLYLRSHLVYTVLDYKHTSMSVTPSQHRQIPWQKVEGLLDDCTALETILQQLLVDAETNPSVGESTTRTGGTHPVSGTGHAGCTWREADAGAAVMRAHLRRADMVGEAVDCLKLGIELEPKRGRVSTTRCLHSRRLLITAAEGYLVGAQLGDGGWPHDEGRLSLFTSISRHARPATNKRWPAACHWWALAGGGKRANSDSSKKSALDVVMFVFRATAPCHLGSDVGAA